jgi:hypothetical protein
LISGKFVDESKCWMGVDWLRLGPHL